MASRILLLVFFGAAAACGRPSATSSGSSSGSGAGCDAGDAAACVQLARDHLAGRLGPVDKPRAIGLLEKACTARDGAACRQAAAMQAETPHADRLLQTGCDHGDGHSCIELVAILRTAGRDAAKADQLFGRGRTLLEKKCAAGDADGCMGLARVYGSFAPPDEAKAAEHQKKAAGLYETACNGGDGQACLRLAMAHHDGLAGQSDFDRYRTLAERSCELGHLEGCAETAAAYRTTEPTDDDPKAPALFEKACLGGVVLRQPCREAGFLYADGDHVAADKVKGLRLLEMSCALDDVSSCLMAAAMYRDGDGVPVDAAKAARLAKSLDALDIKIVSVKRTKEAANPIAFQMGVSPSDLPPVKAEKGKELIVVSFDVQKKDPSGYMPIRSVWLLDTNGERHPSLIKHDAAFGEGPGDREMVFIVPAGTKPVKLKFELGALSLDLPEARKG